MFRSMKPSEILKLTPSGLYCEAGDFYIDPVRKVSRAVITHGHSDHARPGHGAVLATQPTLDVMKARYGPNFTSSQQSLNYNDPITLAGTSITLKPAGHVIGSAQVIVESAGHRVVVTGDYKRTRDPTCPSFEPISCDIFITEATFGLPIFRHPAPETQILRLLNSVTLFSSRPHFIAAYSLGKAQRLITLLREAGYDEPVYVDRATAKLCALYENHGVPLGTIKPVDQQSENTLKGKICIAPPTMHGTLFGATQNPPITSFASGWLSVRKRAISTGGNLPLVISDHADWRELTETASEVAPEELWITHGAADALIAWATSRGMKARPLSIKGYGQDDGPSH